MDIIGKILTAITLLAFMGAAFVPDIIANVNKAMRMGKAYYPKEKRKKKWIWVGIFVLTRLVAAAINLLLLYAAE